ncbi:MAG: hypothetical protein Kow0022_06780 [Phycisphaerales bacterium]
MDTALLPFSARGVPSMSRPNYRSELASSLLLPWAVAVTEGSVVGVIAKNAFEGIVGETVLNFAVATLAAAPAVANIISFAWVRLSHGRAKVAFINGLQVTLVALVAAMALVPRTPLGLAMLVAIIVLARLAYAGIVTLRSTVWAANYPTRARARVTGRLATVQSEIVAVAGLLIGLAMKWDARSYRVLTPALALVGLLGAWRYSKVRVRHHRRLIARERQTDGADRPSFNPASLVRVLSGDRAFAAFMWCQMLIGFGNLMMSPVLTVILKDRFGIGYEGVIVNHTIPLVVIPLFIPMWARLLDRVHIVWFRAIHSWVFVAAAALHLVAALEATQSLLYLGALVKGIGFAGGAMAWSLGHLDFAPPDRSSQYMGVHVTLTGVRGLLAPVIGMQIYSMLEARQEGAGSWVFALALASIIAGAIGFAVLGRSLTSRRGRLGKPEGWDG